MHDLAHVVLCGLLTLRAQEGDARYPFPDVASRKAITLLPPYVPRTGRLYQVLL